MRDLYHNLAVKPALAPAVRSDDAVGTVIDLAGFNSAMIVVNTGAIVGNGDFNVAIQESENGVDDFNFTDLADLPGFETVPGTLAANSTYRVGYIGSQRRRFIRLVLGKNGGTSIAISAAVVLGNPAIAPVAA